MSQEVIVRGEQRVNPEGNVNPGFTRCIFSISELEILLDYTDIYKEELQDQYGKGCVPDPTWEEAQGLRDHLKNQLKKARQKKRREG